MGVMEKPNRDTNTRRSRVLKKSGWAIMSALGSSLTLALGYFSLYWIPIAFIFFIVFCFLVYRRIYELTEKNDSFENSCPKVVVNKAYVQKNVKTTDFVSIINGIEQIRNTGGTQEPSIYNEALRNRQGSTKSFIPVEEEQSYIVIEFKNNPERRNEIHNANGVIARINYFDDADNNILKREIKGLWAGSEPSATPDSKPYYIFNKIDMPASGDERILCVALKNRAEQDCYSYAYESYTGNNKFLKNNNLNLGMGTIRVDILLSGDNLDDTPFRFRIVNPGIGREVSITELKNEEIIQSLGG
jgi:hypothetical protein